MRNVALLVAGLVTTFAPSAFAVPETNVALNAEVSLAGTFFSGGYPGGWVVDPQTVVDGVFLPSSTYWQQGGVWWHEPATGAQQIVIDMHDKYRISGFTVQVDDNDAYELYYRVGSTDAWRLVWAIPNYDIYLGRNLFGMQTRPDPDDDFVRYSLAAPVVATELMIRGGAHSDFLYSVSEIQAFGHAVAEPASAMLLGIGLLVGARRLR